MLRLEGVHAGYGDVPVLHDLSLRVEEGEVVALLGSNGAGKTTLLRCISGLIPVTAGSIEFDGADLTGAEPHTIVSRGLIHVPEGRQLFGDLTVAENLEMGSFLPDARKKRAERMAWAFDLFPILRDRRSQTAGTLSGGEQQMLAIARGLMAWPRLLVLDEPSLGVAPVILDGILATLRDINREGVTLLLVEQNAIQALDLAARAYVLSKGQITISGAAKEVASDPGVKRAYLGLASAASGAHVEHR